MLLTFYVAGLESFLTLDEPICPRFLAEFYHSLEVKRDEEERPYIEFKLGQFTFNLDTSTSKRPNKLQIDDIRPELRGWELFFRENFFCTLAIVPPNMFTFHDRVMNPLDISRNPIKEKVKKVASLLVSSSSSSSSDGNEAPSFLEFYEKLSDIEDLTVTSRPSP
nr:hypothetical protein [Tanacetum cinerariifolium]